MNLTSGEGEGGNNFLSTLLDSWLISLEIKDRLTREKKVIIYVQEPHKDIKFKRWLYYGGLCTIYYFIYHLFPELRKGVYGFKEEKAIHGKVRIGDV